MFCPSAPPTPPAPPPPSVLSSQPLAHNPPKPSPKLQLRPSWRRRDGAAPLAALVTAVVACSTPSFQGRAVASGGPVGGAAAGAHLREMNQAHYTHPPQPPAPSPAPATLMYWSCLLPVNASQWCQAPGPLAGCVWGGAFIVLSCHMTPAARF